MVFLVDGLLLAVLGAVVGVAVGIALAWTMAQMEWTTLGVGKQINYLLAAGWENKDG